MNCPKCNTCAEVRHLLTSTFNYCPTCRDDIEHIKLSLTATEPVNGALSDTITISPGDITTVIFTDNLDGTIPYAPGWYKIKSRSSKGKKPYQAYFDGAKWVYYSDGSIEKVKSASGDSI